jgi:hypothetical protein
MFTVPSQSRFRLPVLNDRDGRRAAFVGRDVDQETAVGGHVIVSSDADGIREPLGDPRLKQHRRHAGLHGRTLYGDRRRHQRAVWRDVYSSLPSFRHSGAPGAGGGMVGCHILLYGGCA